MEMPEGTGPEAGSGEAGLPGERETQEEGACAGGGVEREAEDPITMEEVVVEVEEMETPTVLLTPEGEGRETGSPSRGEASGGEGTAAGMGGQDLEDGGQDAAGEVRTGA